MVKPSVPREESDNGEEQCEDWGKGSKFISYS
jgi:hypothetical protein